MNFTTSTTVSPSPRALVEKLSDDEKVAIDLLLSESDALSARARDLFATLVPNEKRREYLQTLAAQLAVLGVRVHESAEFDARTGHR